MSKLSVDQKTIKDLFQSKRADFLIPDYQRPYAWGKKECQTLWDDIFSFAIPDEGRTEFDSNSEYFLGPIVTYENKGRMEVIDGQQRLTTLMLLLRAFYSKFGHMQDKASISTKQNIEKCLWKTDEFGEPNMRDLKIDSDVATDDDKGEFLEILKTGEVKKEQKSRYVQNFRFFQNCIDSFLERFPLYLAHLSTRTMTNCILLPIEAESQDTALRIFSTLNDRGTPLSDSDIFKAQFYKFYSSIWKKDEFIKRWKELDALCNKTFQPNSTSTSPMDELFAHYMYFVRAGRGIKLSTTEALRKFYERDGYILLKNEETFESLVVLANFWNEVSNQDEDRFSVNILRKLFVLNYAPNRMWTYFVSVYFMQNRDEDGNLKEKAFAKFLDKITGFIWAYAVTNPSVSSLRTPVYAEMVNIVNNQPVTFVEHRFDEDKVRSMFNNFSFNKGRPITKAMLTWWAFTNKHQGLLSLENAYDIEHIYARNRQKNEESLSNPNNLDVLGNMTLLEKRINIRASDYRFEDKKKYYKGFVRKGQKREGTKIRELVDLATSANDFTESDIIKRNKKIIEQFILFLRKEELLMP